MKIEFTLSELDKVAARLWERFPDARVFAFYGDLGVGKSTLIREMLRQKGVDEAVPSPTFALVQTYRERFHHFDLYRIKDYDEFCRAALDELLYSGTSFVEWPEILEDWVDMVKIKLEYGVENDARVLYLCDDNQR